MPGWLDRVRLRHLLVGVPVVAVSAVLSAAAVVALVHQSSADLAAVDAPVDASVGTRVDPSAPATSGAPAPASSELPSLVGGKLPIELPEVGTYARATVRPDGAVVVLEWVRTVPATTSVTLSLPLGAPEDGAASEVVVMSADGPATGPAEITSSSSYVVAAPSTLFVARYVLTGVARLSPMSETRALVQPVALSLTAGPSGGEPVGGPRRLSVESASVLTLACSVPGEATALTPCGAPDGDEWQVELDSTRWSALVAAQVELN